MSSIVGNVSEIVVTRWRGGQHPSQQAIVRKMEEEGLRPYAWTNGPNFRYAIRSHGYGKVLYCVEGSLEINLPDMNQRVVLRSGDRIDLPHGVRHAMIIGSSGARCLESASN